MRNIDNNRRAAILEKAGALMALRADHGRDVAIERAITSIVAGAVFLEREIGPQGTADLLLSTAGQVRPASKIC